MHFISVRFAVKCPFFSSGSQFSLAFNLVDPFIVLMSAKFFNTLSPLSHTVGCQLNGRHCQIYESQLRYMFCLSLQVSVFQEPYTGRSWLSCARKWASVDLTWLQPEYLKLNRI